jgi:hypothetical protein
MPRAFRAIQFGLVALTLVLVSTANAEPKKKIAVLGLEAVVGANGQIDPADTAFAKELTKELRSRANNSKGFDLTKDQRELVDEKLMNNCGSEQAQCMAPIGQSMGAEVLLFGRVANAKGGYKVSLTLVDVRKRTVIGTDPNATITAGETKNPGLGNWVRDHYKKLMGESNEGQVIITAAGANGGRVLVNGETRETLKSGSATLSLPEGRYRIGVEADGFKLWEQDVVTVSTEKSVELKPELVKSGKPIDTTIKPEEGTTGTTGTDNLISRENTVSHKKNKTVWKVAAGVGLGAAAVGTGLIIYSYTQMSAFKDAAVNNAGWDPNKSGTIDETHKTVDQSDCGSGGEFINRPMTTGGNASSLNDKFSTACSAKDRMTWLVPTTIGFAAVGAGALIYVMVSNDKTEERPAGAAGRRQKKKNFIVTPVVTPDGTGATLRFDW